MELFSTIRRGQSDAIAPTAMDRAPRAASSGQESLRGSIYADMSRGSMRALTSRDRIRQASALEVFAKQTLESLAGGDKFRIDLGTHNMANPDSSDSGRVVPNHLNGFPQIRKAPRKTEELISFLKAIEASEVSEAVSGGHYWVSDQVEVLNGKLLTEALLQSDHYKVLQQLAEQKTLFESLRYVYESQVLRNRNPLHANRIDATVISLLLSAVKHLFNLPYAAYATNGNDSLSSVLYDYRSQFPEKCEVVLIGAGEQLKEREACIERLNLMARSVDSIDQLLQAFQRDELDVSNICCIVVDRVIEPHEELPERVRNTGLPIHIHISDQSFRGLLAQQGVDGSVKLHPQCGSLSTATGLFKTSFSLFRHFQLRDHQISVPRHWKTVYLSQNEGGSSNLRPLIEDLMMLYQGQVAMDRLVQTLPTSEWQPKWLQATAIQSRDSVGLDAPQFGTITEYSQGSDQDKTLMQESLKVELLRSALAYVGGRRNTELYGFLTGGGTRSITRALECITHHAKQIGCNEPHIVVGDPHFAVERNESKLGFVADRLVEPDGTLSLKELDRVISSPKVMAVYAQSLSYTSGLSDPVPDIFARVEQENRLRVRMGEPLITLIVDSCLALGVLLHDPAYRVLDFEGITPRIVTFDLHKHIGADKGVSVTIGTVGTYDCLNGYPQIGSEPDYSDLYRAYSSMQLVGEAGYQLRYRELHAEIQRAMTILEGAGVHLIMSERRVNGSTVIAAYDPFAALSGILKKRYGIDLMPLFNLPGSCQTGWQLSVTLNHLQPASGGHHSKLIEFAQRAADEYLLLSQQAVYSRLVASLPADNTIATGVYGGLEPVIFSLLSEGSAPYPVEKVAHSIVKRYMTAQLDRDLLHYVEPQDPE